MKNNSKYERGCTGKKIIFTFINKEHQCNSSFFVDVLVYN